MLEITSSGDLVGNCGQLKNMSLVGGTEGGCDEDLTVVTDAAVDEAMVEFSAAGVAAVVEFSTGNVAAEDPVIAVVFPASSPPSPDPVACVICLKLNPLPYFLPTILLTIYSTIIPP